MFCIESIIVGHESFLVVLRKSALMDSFLCEARLAVLLYCTITLDRDHAGHG